MKNLFYSLVGLSSFGLNFANAETPNNGQDPFGEKNVDMNLPNTPADSEVQRLISNAMKFLYLIAVVYALWGGFLILTAGGKDEQVKKGRTVIIQAAIGLVVIWLANSIVYFVVNSIIGA
ncbi:MAG: pilin [Candidatus Gracilibacteria bacterium]|nr:pilin [Candidatus Gracilibacteria bacterium]